MNKIKTKYINSLPNMFKYSVYKTTNLINGKFYWGVHNSINKSDGYLGSGLALKKAIKKYGKNNFECTIKLLYKTEKEAYEDEKFIVTPKMTKQKNCYNINPGGIGAASGKNNPMYGKKGQNTGRIFTEDHRKKISENHADFSGENNPMFGKHFSEESKEKQSISKKGKNLSQEHKKKISVSMKKFFENSQYV